MASMVLSSWKVVVEDPIEEPICGPVVVAGVFFSQNIGRMIGLNSKNNLTE